MAKKMKYIDTEFEEQTGVIKQGFEINGASFHLVGKGRSRLVVYDSIIVWTNNLNGLDDESIVEVFKDKFMDTKQTKETVDTYTSNMKTHIKEHLDRCNTEYLSQLEKLVEDEKSRELCDEEKSLYVELYDRLKKNGVEIPFGVEI
jgi:hypothetical protein